MWSSRRILKDLADTDRRRKILMAFWKHGETTARLIAAAHLAKILHFREETLRKMPIDKKADLLASRIGLPEFDQFLDAALMQYHTHNATEMMGAFLDRWEVPHKNGSIESEDYIPPTADKVRAAVRELEGIYDRADITLYLASAGLLMEQAWRDATWPVVEEMVNVSN